MAPLPATVAARVTANAYREPGFDVSPGIDKG